MKSKYAVTHKIVVITYPKKGIGGSRITYGNNLKGAMLCWEREKHDNERARIQFDVFVSDKDDNTVFYGNEFGPSVKMGLGTARGVVYAMRRAERYYKWAKAQGWE